MSLFLLALLWALWCGVHSGLIAPGTQRFLKNRLGNTFRFFRLFYNGFALVSLLPLLMFSHSLRTVPLCSWSGGWQAAWIFLWGLVFVLGYLGARAYDMGAFTGLRQALAPAEENGPPEPLNQTGILALIRHPWYLAALILFWIRGLDITLSMVVENLVLTLYIFIGIRLEENKLTAAYGHAYSQYQKAVPSLLPRVKDLSAMVKKLR